MIRGVETSRVDYSRKWYVMAAVAMGVFLATIDSSIVNVALPTLTRAFQTEFAIVQWVVLGYLLTVTTLLLSVGRWADMIGKKPLYTAGFVIFTLGSALCGLSPTVYALIGFRVLQAVGASMTAALGTAIITEAFPPAERGKALGISGAVVSVGIVVGPTLGGLLIDALSWRWIFFVNLPIGIVGTWMVTRFVPAIKPAGGQRFDFLGAITLFVSLLALLLALTFGQRIGFMERRVLALFGSSVVCVTLFLRIELRRAQPMIDLRLFRDSQFSVGLLTGLLAFIAVAGALILMPFFLENVLGYTTRVVGLLLAALPIGLGLTAPVSGILSDRFGTRLITVVGLAILVIGYFAVRTLDQNTTAAGFLLRFLPIGVGMGVFQSPNNSAIMGSAPRERLGVASGMLAITRTLGQTTGIATLGALWASRVAVYSNGVNPGDATAAPAAAQVGGLHDTALIIILIIIVALVLAGWGLAQQRRGQRVAALASE